MKAGIVIGGLIFLILLALGMATAESCLGYRLPFGWTTTFSCPVHAVTLTCAIILVMIGGACALGRLMMEPVHQRERRIDTPPDV